LKQILTRIDTTLLILLSASIVLIEFNERNSTFFLAWLLIFILLAFFIMVLIYSFVRSYYSRLMHPTLVRFLPFVLGLLMIPVLWMISDYLKNNGFKSVVLKADYEAGHSGVNLTLYKDNTYQLLNSGPFGGQYTRGYYRFVKDTLYIDTGKQSNGFAATRFVLRVNDRQEKYFDPLTVDSSRHKWLFVRKDMLTNRR
jgi:hypothetical protein